MSCLTNDTKVSDLSVLRTKIYDFELVYFFMGDPVLSEVLKRKAVNWYCFLSFIMLRCSQFIML